MVVGPSRRLQRPRPRAGANLQHIQTNGAHANLVTPLAVTPSTGPSSFVLRSLPTRKATPGCCDNSQLCPTQTSEDFSHMEQPTLDSRSFHALRDGGSLPRPRPVRLRSDRQRTQSKMVQPRLPPPYTRALTTSATTTTTSSPTWRRSSAAYVPRAHHDSEPRQPGPRPAGPDDHYDDDNYDTYPAPTVPLPAS